MIDLKQDEVELVEAYVIFPGCNYVRVHAKVPKGIAPEKVGEAFSKEIAGLYNRYLRGEIPKKK